MVVGVVAVVYIRESSVTALTASPLMSVASKLQCFSHHLGVVGSHHFVDLVRSSILPHIVTT